MRSAFIPSWLARTPGSYLAAACLVFGAVGSVIGADLVAVPELGLRVARGFRVREFAGPALADDIQCLTLDARGNVVVSGPGYIRTLLDVNGDGVADRALDFAFTPGGGMGMCFDGANLLFMGDGGLWRFQDGNGDGQSEGRPERLFTIPTGEHGGHAIRHGPDGLWYVIGGNDAKLDDSQFNTAALPYGKVEGGALVRLGSSNRPPEVIAHGFRNPYDFDFNEWGDIFTYDSDGEREVFLPWYVPTRIYHVTPAGHHGWRLAGSTRSWPRPGRYVDTVSSLFEIGRGSPTGVACYRHRQFPDRYQGGLFALDWTFGRVYFLPLDAEGATYRTAAEVFLEATGNTGFAPTDIAVAPDGSLFISTGGRRTRGAVYHIEHVMDPSRAVRAARWRELPASAMELVLTAPQPLDAWSRGEWAPRAVQLGQEPFAIALADRALTPEQRIRVIEILTELYGGLTPAEATGLAQAPAPSVRARAAWSMGLFPPANAALVLGALARDPAANVRCAALQAMRPHPLEIDLVTRQQALAVNLAHPDKRVRQDAARLAAALPELAWTALWKQQQSGLPQARLTLALAALWRTPPVSTNTVLVETALAVLTQSHVPDLQAQALRIILMTLGDYHLEKPSRELYTAFEPAQPLALPAELVRRLEKALLALLPSGNSAVDLETARLLAMIESGNTAAPGKILAVCGPASDPVSDFHYLTTFSRLNSPTVTNHTTALAAVLLGMDRKLEGHQHQPKQVWGDRFFELAQVLFGKDSRLATAVMVHQDFARPAHLALVPLLGSDKYVQAARLYFNAVQRAADFPWTEPLIDLLSALPASSVHPLFRKQLSNLTLRDRLLLELASAPAPGDRAHFIAGLESQRPEVMRASMSALLQLPRDEGNTTSIAVLRLLRRLLQDPAAQTARAQAVALLIRLSGQKFTVADPGPDLAAAYQPVFDWFATRYSALPSQLDADDRENPAQWEAILRTAPWGRGDAQRGAALFAERGCQACHASARSVGPDLRGAAQRLSRNDLFNAILFPSRDIAPAYRMTTFQLRNGQSYTGLIAYDSAEATLVQTAQDMTVRLAGPDIVGRKVSTVSFMPSGLLAGLRGSDLADLYAYLKELAPK
jgi:putative heme-binding domain-containing protein